MGRSLCTVATVKPRLLACQGTLGMPQVAVKESRCADFLSLDLGFLFRYASEWAGSGVPVQGGELDGLTPSSVPTYLRLYATGRCWVARHATFRPGSSLVRTGRNTQMRFSIFHGTGAPGRLADYHQLMDQARE